MEELQEFFTAREQALGAMTTSLLALGPKSTGLSVEVLSPRERDRGLFACPAAFTLAKRLGEDPLVIAHKLAVLAQGELEKIPADKRLLETAASSGGYVNFNASQLFYSLSVTQAARMAGSFGKTSYLSGKKIVVEFSQPNVGKPFHIGHIRSTILGDTISNLLASQGATVVRFNYLGDAGTQVAKLVLALSEFHDMPSAVDEKGLLDYYTRIHKEIEDNPQLSEKAREILAKIEEADPATLEVVEKIRRMSMSAFNRNYELLGVVFDEVTGESLFIVPAKKSVNECIEGGIALKEKDGSVVANLEPHGLPNTILLRSNGTTLYLTRDLALADYKKGKYGFTDSLIITASEQNMHFRQLQKILGLLGRDYAPVYNHMGFGLVFLQSGRLSTREGRVVFLEDVLNEAIGAAKAEISLRKQEYSPEEIEAISHTVGIGSTKFAFLRVSSERNITFDPATSARFDGDTGAYVQYTCVRARNILRKLEASGQTISSPLSSISPDFTWSASEQRLAQSIASFPAVVESAAVSRSPHVVCEYLLKLSADFSSFYESKQVIDKEHPLEQAARTVIVEATAQTIANGLELLGIKVPSKM